MRWSAQAAPDDVHENVREKKQTRPENLSAIFHICPALPLQLMLKLPPKNISGIQAFDPASKISMVQKAASIPGILESCTTRFSPATA